jgi:hypothetical protein
MSGDTPMMIYMLAISMTVATLIATAFSLHQEADRARARSAKRINGFGFQRNRPRQF